MVIRTSDPRLWGIHKPWTALLVFLCLTLLFAWGNVRVKRGGILDANMILRDDDPMRQIAGKHHLKPYVET